MHDDLRARLRDSYNRKAHERDSRTLQAWKAEERHTFLTLLQQEQKHSVLEIGAGTGLDAKLFQDQGLTVVCVDLSPEMVRLCQQKGLTAHVMDFAELTFPPNSFDAVYALNCLLHLPKRELPGVLNSINSILNSNGLFYLGVYGGYDHEGIWDKDSYEPKRFFTFYTDELLQHMVAETFQVYSFKRIPLEGEDAALHFQSVILRKTGVPATTVSQLGCPTSR